MGGTLKRPQWTPVKCRAFFAAWTIDDLMSLPQQTPCRWAAMQTGLRAQGWWEEQHDRSTPKACLAARTASCQEEGVQEESCRCSQRLCPGHFHHGLHPHPLWAELQRHIFKACLAARTASTQEEGVEEESSRCSQHLRPGHFHHGLRSQSSSTLTSSVTEAHLHGV